MDVRNFFRGVARADMDGFDVSAHSHQRIWAANRAATVSWNEDDEESTWLSGGQSSSGREPRRVVRASGRVGAERSGNRHSR